MILQNYVYTRMCLYSFQAINFIQTELLSQPGYVYAVIALWRHPFPGFYFKELIAFSG
jgi:hypothetical protein